MSIKKHFMILDTETTSTARIPFDIAYTIIDRKGNIVEQKNYLTADEFHFIGRILRASSQKFFKQN